VLLVDHLLLKNYLQDDSYKLYNGSRIHPNASDDDGKSEKHKIIVINTAAFSPLKNTVSIKNTSEDPPM